MRPRGPALAAVPGWPLFISAVLAVMLLGLLGRDPVRLVEVVRWGAVALALGVAGIFDDPSAELHASMPTPDRRVRLQAIAVALPVLVVAWLTLTWLGDQDVLVGSAVDAALEDCVALARRGLGLEAVGVLALTLAATAFAARRGGGTSSAIAGGSAAVMAYAGRLFLPDRLTVAASPLDARWLPGHQLRWVLLAAVGAAALLLLAGDRWRRPSRWRTAGRIAMGLVVAMAFTLTARSREPVEVFQGLVDGQELAAADVSAGGPVVLELRHGSSPGDVAVIDVSIITHRATTRTQVLVAGSTTAAEVRSWSTSLPRVADADLLAEVVATSPPGDLRARQPTTPVQGRAVAEVIIDHRTRQTIAAVAAPGRRTCGVSVAGPLHGTLGS